MRSTVATFDQREQIAVNSVREDMSVAVETGGKETAKDLVSSEEEGQIIDDEEEDEEEKQEVEK